MSVRIKGQEYDAVVLGRMTDREWDDRESTAVTMAGGYAEATALWHDGAEWAITTDGEEAYDNSEYSILGDITVHRDGTYTVKMGKPTELEEAYMLLYGGDA